MDLPERAAVNVRNLGSLDPRSSDVIRFQVVHGWISFVESARAAGTELERGEFPRERERILSNFTETCYASNDETSLLLLTAIVLGIHLHRDLVR